MTPPAEGRDGEPVRASEASRPGYDPERVASEAREADPGLPPETASGLAREAWRHLQQVGAADPNEIARRLLAGDRSAGATAANVVAVAAVQYCAVHDVDPQA